MKVIGINEKIYNLKGKYSVKKNKSKYHLKTRQLLKQLFPFEIILEEVYIPGCPTKLYLDFLIPNRRIAIETQGEQHEKYVRHMHGEITGFINSLGRDNLKKQWCELNGIKLVELLYNETIQEWTNKLI